MPNSTGTLESLAIQMGKVFQPLADNLTPGRAKIFFAQMGITLTDGQVATVAVPLGTVVTNASDLLTIIDDLIIAVTAENYVQVTQKGIEAINKIKNIIDAFPALANGLRGAGIPQAVTDKIPERIFNFLLADYLDKAPAINGVLELLGIADRQDFNVDSADPNNPPYTISTYNFGSIGDWLSNPAGKMQSLYDWGSPGFDGRKLFSLVEKLLSRFGLPVLYDELPSPKLDMVFVEIVPKTDINPRGLLVTTRSNFSSGQQTIQQGDIAISFDAGFQLPADAGLVLQPNGKVYFQTPSSAAINGDFNIKLSVKKQSPPEPFVLFGQTGASRFEIGEFAVGTGTRVTWDGSKANGDFSFETSLNQCKVVIDTSSGDGFLAKILPGTNFEADFDIMIGVSTERGFYFGGSSALELRLPAHIDIGPVTIEGLTITLKLQDGKIPVSIGADIKASLGPIVAVVQNIGVTTTFSFPSGGGNLGPLQFDIGFKPPNGVGLSIDAGVIKGGGFLYLDFDKGEYFGALELSFQGIISLKAIGIINTKMPDGSNGFALLILITAEFTPIQLGFGFTLNGVGGLLAVNRSTNIDALKLGVRTGAISSILFPQDIVANINKIISDLKSIFPIVEGHFIIAPMAKLGWGVPTLISLELGIIIDIPAPRIVIIGVIKAVLPTEEAAILKLQVNFAGGIDFEEGLIWFDASLFDSYILIFTLTGDMALRIGWKNPVFIISVGGFHPAFTEIPPDLTGMRRIALSLLSGDNPRLNAQIYFAITSNSVQSGAKVELYAEACGFNIYGYLGYDLLVQFSPFHFIADIYAGLALRCGTSEIAGIHVHCELSGPTPWNANGDASLTILFFTISVGFNVTWGDEGPAQPLETADVLKLIKDALNDKRNWKADLPANTNQGISLKKIELPEDDIIIHPFGVLSVTQKIAPLGITINKFGNKKPGADTLFDLTFGGGATAVVKEEFAMANFVQMSDSEKVSRKSFEQVRSGLVLTPQDNTAHGFEIHKDVTYEMSYVHKKKGLIYKIKNFRLFAGVFTTLVKGNAIAKNAYSVSRKAATVAPAKVDTPAQKFMVVNTADLALHAAGMEVASEAEAYSMHDNLISKDPSLKGTIQVVSNFELN